MRAMSRWMGLFGLVVTAAAVPALAQTSSTPVQYGKCEKQVTDRESEAAHGAYQAGKAAYDEGDYNKALTYFHDAYRRDCNKHELLIIISRAYELKGDKQEAVRALKTYLENAKNPPDAEAQRTKIANLEKQMQQEKAPPPPPSTAAPPPTSTAPPPPQSAEGGHTIPPWIVVGVGGALIAAGVVVQLAGEFKVRDAEAQCPDHEACPGATADPKINYDLVRETGNDGRSLARVGFGLWVVGVAAVGGGLLWHFLEPTGPRATARLRPAVAPGYAGMNLGGSF
jgi:tetratricopeptide (TPR) repeat protein